MEVNMQCDKCLERYFSFEKHKCLRKFLVSCELHGMYKVPTRAKTFAAAAEKFAKFFDAGDIYVVDGKSIDVIVYSDKSSKKFRVTGQKDPRYLIEPCPS